MRRGGLRLGGEVDIEPHPADIIRFMKKVRVVNGCWQWVGLKDKNGYGVFWVPNRDRANRTRRGVNMGAHRFALALFKGRIEAGNDADHCATEECIGKACVHPFKCLEQKSRVDNARDGRKRQLENARKRLPKYVKNLSKVRDRDDIPF